MGETEDQVVERIIRMMSAVLAAELRTSATLLATRPHITATEALNDAAAAIERSAAMYIKASRLN